ncbi:hypothetical protein G9P44_000096 [Scheffersomyces stipitis]|nr:hypothetical protein G9P44_000096 [Scheffersomyces stipitis]
MDEHTIRKRNRPSLVCKPCKKRKIKCDKGKPCTSCVKNKMDHLCVYDEKWIGSKKSKRSKTTVAKVLPLASSVPGVNAITNNGISIHTGVISPTSIKHELLSDSGEKPLQQTKDPNKEKSVVVIVPKSELDELRAKVQRYEHGMISPSRSDNSEEQNSTSSSTSSSYRNINKVYPPPEVSIHFYNRSINPTKRSLYAYHDPDRPGEIPVDDLFVNNQCFITRDMPPPKAKRMTLDDVPKHDYYAVGINPYESPTDTINFYENYNPVQVKDCSKRISFGPLAWATISKKDRTLSLIKKFTSSQKAQSVLERINRSRTATAEPNAVLVGCMVEPPQEELKSTLNVDGSQIKHFEQKVLEEEGYNDVKPYNETKTSSKKQGAKKEVSHNVFRDMDKKSLMLGLTILEKSIDRELKLIEQIQVSLPKQRVIWLLIDRFFKVVYPFVPYLDEEDFRYQVARIIGPEGYEETKVEVNVEKRLDLSYLGVLLVVGRLSYLSLFSNRVSINEKILRSKDLTHEQEVIKYLLMNAVNIGAIDLARECLHQFDLLRKLSFPVLQCALYIRLYNSLAPEDGDGLDGGDGQVFNGMLVQMCYSIGLNREPDNYRETFTDEKTNNLGRKIWYYVVVNDYIQAYTFGNPLTTNSTYYDTKMPFITSDNTNLRDVELDKSIVSCYMFDEALLRGPIREILNQILNINVRVKVPPFTQYVNHLELGTISIFGRIRDYSHRLESEDVSYRFNKIRKAYSLISFNAFFVSVYYYFYDYYESRGNQVLSVFYLKKLLAITVGEMIPYFFPLIIRSAEIFGDGSDLMINPPIIQGIQRTSDSVMIIMVKLNFWLINTVNNPQHNFMMKSDAKYRNYFELVSTLVVCLEKCAKICLMASSIMSSRYYYAWGIYKSHNFLFKVISDREFYTQNLDFESHYIPPTKDQLQDITNLVQNSLNILNRTVGEHCDKVDLRTLFKVYGQVPSVLKDLETANPESMNKPASFNMPIGDFPGLSSPDTPLSDTSSAQGVLLGSFDDLKYDGSAEIDSLWLQMLSQKTNKQNTFEEAFNLVDNNVANSNNIPSGSDSSTFTGSTANTGVSGSGSSAATSTPANGQQPSTDYNFTSTNYQLFESLGSVFDGGANGHFDFFNDLPLDKVFN